MESYMHLFSLSGYICSSQNESPLNNALPTPSQLLSRQHRATQLMKAMRNRVRNEVRKLVIQLSAKRFRIDLPHFSPSRCMTGGRKGITAKLSLIILKGFKVIK